MAWLSPTGGSATNWVDIPNAYDDDTASKAACYGCLDPLELTHSAIDCNKIQIYPTYTRTWVIEVFYDGAYHEIYNGSLAGGEWHEISIPAGTKSVTKARMHTTATAQYLSEFDFWEVEGETHYGSATLSGTGSLSASGRRIVAGLATLSGVGTLAALGGYLHLAAASLTGTGSLSALGQVFKLGAASLSGVGNLAASAAATLAGKATLSGTGSLAALGRSILAGAAALSGQGSLTASAMIVLFGKATLSGTGALSAQGIRIVTGIATLAGVGFLSAAAKVFGLMATLQAAQKKPDRLPYVEARVYDFEQGIKRLSWTRLYEGTEQDNHHGIAFDGQGSMHRIRADGSNLYRQKITSPDESSDYSQWTNIATDCAGPCAIAAQGAKVYIFYKTTGNVLWKLYSHNYGESWSNAQLVDYADVQSMSASWWGTGDIVVCFALARQAGLHRINGIVLDSSDQSTSQHEYTLSNLGGFYTYGIGSTYFSNKIAIIFAGRWSSTPYNFYVLCRTEFSDTYNFLAPDYFLTAPEGEDITYEYPDCHIPQDPQDYEGVRILSVEKFTGTTAYTRPLTSHMVKGSAFSEMAYTEPKPFLNLSSDYGLRITSTASRWWMERPDGVWHAPRTVGAPLDLTQDILSLTQRISSPSTGEGQGEGALTIELDNHRGQYATPGSGALASLRFRSEVVLNLGYKTTEGNLALEAGTYWIDAWEYRSATLQGRASGTSTFVLRCIDGWGLADNWSARHQMRWNKDEVGPKTVWQILKAILGRTGILLTNTPAKPQSSAINNLYPDFTIQAGTSGTAAIRRLLSFVPDKLVFRGQEAFTKNPLSDEASCYSYKFQGEGAIHAILAGEYGEQDAGACRRHSPNGVAAGAAGQPSSPHQLRTGAAGCHYCYR